MRSMTRHAQCQCGALTANVDSEPEGVVICSCNACQRRTGAHFGGGAYFPRAAVTLSGEAREFTRPTDAGNTFHEFFCPTCGSTVYFYSSRDPNRLGIAVGSFSDPNFPPPQRSVFDENKHAWIVFDAAMPGFKRGRDSERTR